MRIYRITYQEQHGKRHTHIVLTDDHLAKVLAQARRLDCTPIVEKLLSESHVEKLKFTKQA